MWPTRRPPRRDPISGCGASLAARAIATAQRLRGILASEPVERLVHLPTWTWTLTFDDFLLSRMVELVVHSDDLAVSAGLPTPSLPPPVIDPVHDLLTRLSARRHGFTAVLRTLTRAERAPATISAF